MNPLKAKILDLIRKDGPIGVGRYMRIALTDPEHGYYMTRDPLGRDFVTAPEISQMFGEIIGLFFVRAWEERGRPERFHLVEMGPGRGTLMSDMLRAARLRKGFGEAANVTLVETSPALRAVQAKTLEGARVYWAEGLGDLEPAPLFFIANEFLDALPARQFVRSDRGWHARTVEASGHDLVFGIKEECERDPFVPERLRGAPAGSILEVGAEAVAAARTIAGRIAEWGGCALLIDYGHSETGFGDTFQAVKAHRYADPLADPGEADLTFHVDFEAVGRAAREAGAEAHGPVAQGAFLRALGVGARAERLRQAAPDRAGEIDAAVDRLTQPEHMGTLFKVLAISDGHVRHLAGF